MRKNPARQTKDFNRIIALIMALIIVLLSFSSCGIAKNEKEPENTEPITKKEDISDGKEDKKDTTESEKENQAGKQDETNKEDENQKSKNKTEDVADETDKDKASDHNGTASNQNETSSGQSETSQGESNKNNAKEETSSEEQSTKPVLPEYAEYHGVPIVIINATLDIDTLYESKANVATGTMIMFAEDGSIIYDGELSSFKGRGSSSWTHSFGQKPFNMKLAKKAELIEGAGAAKKWCLICYDTYNSVAHTRWVKQNTFLNSVIGFNLYKDVGGAYAIDIQPIDLYINGDYRGSYAITEPVQLDKERVNITDTDYDIEGTYTITDTAELISDGIVFESSIKFSDGSALGQSGGFILEMDSNSDDNDDCYFTTARGTRMLFKDPDMPSKDQVLSIAQYFQEFEDAVYAKDGYNSLGKYYAEYFDIESNATLIATKIFLQDGDLYKKSSYFAIDVDENGNYKKIMSGPCWDFDACCMVAGTEYTQFADDEHHWDRNFLAELMIKEDFYNAFRDIMFNRIVPMATEYAKEGGFIDQCIEKYTDSKLASQKRWPTGTHFIVQSVNEDDSLSAAKFAEIFRWYLNEFTKDGFFDDYFNYYIYKSKGIINWTTLLQSFRK